MECVPIASQTTCASPGRTSGPYAKIALPSSSQVISKHPGMPAIPFTRNPALKRPVPRSATKCSTARLNAARCVRCKRANSRRKLSVVS